MTQPFISFCNKRYASMMTELSIAKVAQLQSINFSMPLSAAREAATRDLIQLAISLDSLTDSLNAYKYAFDKVQVNVSKEERKLLDRWSEVKSDLLQRWLFTTLLTKPSRNTFAQFRRLLLLKDKVNETAVYCGTHSGKCNLGYIRPFIGVDHLNCFSYNVNERKNWVESTAQGMENGITFIFMTGSKLLASGLDKNLTVKIPGYSNVYSATAGSEGIQVIIHAPSQSPMPNLDGVNIAPGMSTDIGITSRENIRLPSPYGECTTTNFEKELLVKSVRAELGFEPEAGAGMLATRYTTGACRTACLLRHIWEHCRCLLMSGSLPFFNSSLSCGQLDNNVLFDRSEGAHNSCFDLDRMTKEPCKEKLEKLFDDLHCVRRVLSRQKLETEHSFKCHCPMPCHSEEYDLTIGTSRWPSPGPELDSAYISIVLHKIVPYFRQFNHTMTDEVLNYLLDTKNKAEIMENFARLTVYIKSLKVEKIEEIADYTVLKLFSDIGNKTLFINICMNSTITVAECPRGFHVGAAARLSRIMSLRFEEQGWLGHALSLTKLEGFGQRSHTEGLVLIRTQEGP